MLRAVCLLQGSWNLRDVQFPAGSQIKSWAFTTLVDPSRLVPGGETGTDTFLSVREGPGVVWVVEGAAKGWPHAALHPWRREPRR